MFAPTTFETLSLTASDRPEKSALSVKASTMPISFSVLSRVASAEMENFGRNRFTELSKAEHHKLHILDTYSGPTAKQGDPSQKPTKRPDIPHDPTNDLTVTVNFTNHQKVQKKIKFPSHLLKSESCQCLMCSLVI